jgi:hypothetical protein
MKDSSVNMATVKEPITVAVFPGDDSADALVRNAGHQLLQSHRLEDLPWICTHGSAPTDLLLELCDLGLYLNELGHRRGPRELLERLAERHHYPEAIITLAADLYTDPNESAESFANFLVRFADDTWMLESLARRDPSSQEKADAFLSVVRNHPGATLILHLIEARRDESAAESSTDVTAIERLFATNEPRVLRALADNRSVPRHLLEQLASVRGIAKAAEIRNCARRNLATR